MHSTLEDRGRRCVLLGMIVSACLGGLARPGWPRPLMAPFSINLDYLADSADVVVIGALDSVGRPYDTFNKDFYRVGRAGEVLKGHLPSRHFVVVWLTVASAEGVAPHIERGTSYLLFLRRLTFSDEQPAKAYAFYHLSDREAPHDAAYYRVLNNWEGIIPLERGAAEDRAFHFIQKDYGLDIRNRLGDFRAAMRYRVEHGKVGPREAKGALSRGAYDLWQKLGLGESAEPR